MNLKRRLFKIAHTIFTIGSGISVSTKAKGKMKNEDIITRILSGNADPADRRAFMAWLDECEENRAEFQRLKNIWDATHPAFNPAQIDTRRAENRFFEKIGKEQRSDRIASFTNFMYRAAAILFIPLLIATLYLYRQTTPSTSAGRSIAMQTISVPYGITSSVELPDGSTVWLNSGTSFKYPVQFDSNTRQVELIEGEAFFEVQADPQHPFIVNTNHISVTATGTRFNVNAYPDENSVYVSLDKGRVNITDHTTQKLIAMSPGEILNYNKADNSYSLRSGNVYNTYAWIDGITIFRDVTLKEVFNKLAQKYNVKFIIQDPEINSYPYHATFENESLSEILDVLKEGNAISSKDISKQHCEVKGKKVYQVSKTGR